MLNKILSFYTKYFAVWVILFGVAAYFVPGPFVAMKDYNKLFFALTMFGIGAVLQIEDFKRILQRPAIVLIGSAAQFSIMPLGAFVLTKAFGFEPEIAVGLILTGSAPGAMASNVMSYIAKAGYPVLGYGARRGLYGNRALVFGFRYQALLKRKTGEGFADFPRYLGNVHNFYLLSGNRLEPEAPAQHNRADSGSGCNIKRLRDVSGLRRGNTV